MPEDPTLREERGSTRSGSGDVALPEDDGVIDFADYLESLNLLDAGCA